ncbi:MAG: DUF6166 domain-containing protein [Sulfurimonas sp.]|nr:DUF6166 domain-containing protein [Sulfurimonas sp.]MDQ7061984.1 DUF6166 domain-containing protein [Sulfurimonas sp.]
MAININNHVFKGHKTLLGSKYVTYGEIELPLRFDLYSKAKSGFDWGHNGPASMQLSFSILYQVSDKETASALTIRFTQEVVKQELTKPALTLSRPMKKTRPRKENIVKTLCKELSITQKQLAHILEVPEGTVSSWAVKNEIPRLGKKAIEFYTLSTKNQKIVDSYKDFIHLLQAS